MPPHKLRNAPYSRHIWVGVRTPMLTISSRTQTKTTELAGWPLLGTRPHTTPDVHTTPTATHHTTPHRKPILSHLPLNPNIAPLSFHFQCTPAHIHQATSHQPPTHHPTNPPPHHPIIPQTRHPTFHKPTIPRTIIPHHPTNYPQVYSCWKLQLRFDSECRSDLPPNTSRLYRLDSRRLRCFL